MIMKMDYENLFARFDKEGKLLLPGQETLFGEIPWSKHSAFEGVELKHIVTSKQTGGQFSFHLVRIAPDQKIGSHVHKTQLETHEIIAGSGICINGGAAMRYEPGVISILPMDVEHEVTAGSSGLYLFAKFILALN